jgi:DNA-binding NarL/FixJ family response regulator
VLRAVRRLEPDIGFVVFSNNADAAYRKRYLGEGARCFLDKSTEVDGLVTAVEAVRQSEYSQAGPAIGRELAAPAQLSGSL